MGQNVMEWLDSLHATTPEGSVTNEKWAEAQAARTALVDLIAAARLIVDGAMPATSSGATCFVPRYQIDNARAALAHIGGAA